MRTKERFATGVRLLCFVILLTATAIRFGVEFYENQPVRAAEPTEEIYPTMLYSPTEPTARAEPPTNAPEILIVHTHATEAYCNTPDARTTDTSQNVVHIGEVLAQTLNDNGICTLHDTTLIDAEGYYDAYPRAAEVIATYLQEYPSIQMVIDVHRDSVTDSSGNELPLSAQISGTPAAQLMLVMGTNASGMEHPNWEGNLAFATQLQAFCEERAPGVFRKLDLRSQRYNQHLTPRSMLLEVGTAGNTMQEAEVSIRFFALCLAELLQSEG